MFKCNFIEGKCMQMCPEEERKMRERERLLHPLEIIPGTEKNPKADKNRVVKCFSRSAAGKNFENPNNIRPTKVLLDTVSYLLFDVVGVDYLPWPHVYEFISDRLRAVRQDMVVQNLSPAECITILQPIVSFYAYSAYRLCDEDINNFDSVINCNQMQECMKRLLYCYGQFDTNKLNDNNEFLHKNRPKFEALYVLHNIGNEEAIWHCLKLPPRWRNEFIVSIACKISISFKLGNFVRVCKLIKTLPPLLALTAALKLSEIRKKAFEIMSTAYNSKNLGFSLDDLKDLLIYNSKNQLVKDCSILGMNSCNNYIYFTKKSFNNTKTISRRHEKFVEEKLNECDLQSLILLDNN